MRRNGRKVISEKKTSGSKTIEKQDVAIRREWRWFLIRLLILIGILYLLFGVMFGITTVKNEDMAPRISAGDLVLYYRLDKQPLAGDIIICNKNGKQYVDRVIAKGGDSVEITEEGTVKVKGRGQRSLHAFEEFVKKECPQIQQVIVCDSMEEAVKDSDIICVTSTAPVKEIDFPYIAEDWVKKGALICLPSAARFDDDFLITRRKKVVDNYKLYEAWAEEFPYPSYEMVQIIGSKFTDYLHEGRIQREDIVDIADIINK